MKIKIGWVTVKPTKLTKSDWDTKSRETWCSEISDKILSSFFVTLGPANQRVVVSGFLTIVINLFGFVNHVQRARFFFLACIQFATRFVCFRLAFSFPFHSGDVLSLPAAPKKPSISGSETHLSFPWEGYRMIFTFQHSKVYFGC